MTNRCPTGEQTDRCQSLHQSAIGRRRSSAGLKQLLAGAEITPGKDILIYCRVGTRASAPYFLGRHLE